MNIRSSIFALTALLLLLGLSSCDTGGHGVALASVDSGAVALVSPRTLLNNSQSQDIKIGMKRELVKAQFDASQVLEINNSIIEVEDPDSQYPGKWIFNFNDEVLTWFVFNSSSTDISRSNFDTYLKMAEGLITKYSQALGRSGRITRGILEFRDPALTRHQGYQVLNAIWEDGNSRVLINYSFIGEGNNYSFLVSLQVS